MGCGASEETVSNRHIAGGTFTGKLVAGVPEGKGRMVFDTTMNCYDGEWRDGKMHGIGTFTWGSVTQGGMRFEGNFKKNEILGRGKLFSLADTSKVIADDFFLRDLNTNASRDAFCRRLAVEANAAMMVKFDNGVYVGQFDSSSRKHGKGTYTWASGQSYHGDWVLDRMEGTGEFSWPDGRKFTGGFRQDLFNGQGRYRFGDGAILAGSFVDDKFQGAGQFFAPGSTVGRPVNFSSPIPPLEIQRLALRGIYTNDGPAAAEAGPPGPPPRPANIKPNFTSGINGDMTPRTFPSGTYLGQVDERSRRHGRGEFWSNSGEHYVGDWANDCMHGEGCLSWPDGRRFEGHLYFNLFHGKGSFSWGREGHSFTGIFSQGKATEGTYECGGGRGFKGKLPTRAVPFTTAEIFGLISHHAQTGQAPSATQPVGRTAVPKASDKWRCGRCTFQNDNKVKSCIVCHLEKGAAPPAQASPPSAEAVDDDDGGLERGDSMTSIGGDAFCVICLCEPRSHIVVPCGHLCLCEACAECLMKSEKTKKCPLCRGKMNMNVKVYK